MREFQVFFALLCSLANARNALHNEENGKNNVNATPPAIVAHETRVHIFRWFTFTILISDLISGNETCLAYVP